MELGSKQKALKIAALALEKHADNLKVLDLRGIVTFAAFFVICSADSVQQVKAIFKNIEDGMSALKIKPLGIEGRKYCHWVLMDYDEVIVHVFETETREYYELENFWLDAAIVPVDESTDTVGGQDKGKAYA